MTLTSLVSRWTNSTILRLSLLVRKFPKMHRILSHQSFLHFVIKTLESVKRKCCLFTSEQTHIKVELKISLHRCKVEQTAVSSLTRRQIQMKLTVFQHVPTRLVSTCLVAAIPSSCQARYAKYECRCGEEMIKNQKKGLHILFLSDNDKTVLRSATAVCVSVRSQGLVLNAACQLAQWMPQPPLPAPSLLPSGHSSGHAHGCYSPARPG